MLSGGIPDEVGQLARLEQLFLQSNQLSGGIPSILGNLSQLSDLNLVHNYLTGQIPSSLMQFLANFEYNCLSGAIGLTEQSSCLPTAQEIWGKITGGIVSGVVLFVLFVWWVMREYRRVKTAQMSADTLDWVDDEEEKEKKQELDSGDAMKFNFSAPKTKKCQSVSYLEKTKMPAPTATVTATQAQTQKHKQTEKEAETQTSTRSSFTYGKPASVTAAPGKERKGLSIKRDVTLTGLGLGLDVDRTVADSKEKSESTESQSVAALAGAATVCVAELLGAAKFPARNRRTFELYARRLLTALARSLSPSLSPPSPSSPLLQSPLSAQLSSPSLPSPSDLHSNPAASLNTPPKHYHLDTNTNAINSQLALVVLSALLFLRRFAAAINASANATPGLEFRLFTVALMLATKMLEDQCLVRNKEWAGVCGNLHLSTSQLAEMEIAFLATVNYNLLTPLAELSVLASSLSGLLPSYSSSSFQYPYCDFFMSPATVRVACTILDNVVFELDTTDSFF
ncbi:hypothetical protein HK100_005545 [Physocladia obscura]|uniref:Cyclin N-terminal domain-containing protein n=1 Tax=Physocladia obscura TaxID=109957 RepID=A0AAD5STL5_9FUNG|nr:hypothetical protein HK100_005545 [Physocladia obscura]